MTGTYTLRDNITLANYHHLNDKVTNGLRGFESEELVTLGLESVIKLLLIRRTGMYMRLYE